MGRPDTDASEPTALERLRRIRGVTWDWREDTDDFHDAGVERQMGVVAQEVAEVFPDAVRTGDSGMLQVDYAGLVAALIESVKELADRVDELEARLEPAGE